MSDKIIGIIGGGQLARMMAQAADRLNIATHIFCPEPDAPALAVAKFKTIAAYDEQTALAKFAASVDAITYEFENIPAASLATLAQQKTIYPPVRALEISQDRLVEKNFIRKQNIATANFHPINNAADIAPALEKLGGEGILKTRRFGYDGKGQWRLTSAPNSPDTAPIDIENHPCILEAVIDFDKEISIVIARNSAGNLATFDPIENTHENHILRQSTLPANVAPTLAVAAQTQAQIIAAALDYVGVLAVEYFVLGDKLLVNEIAPRVHNSGHLTADACACGQFEQHIRAVLGLPLGDTTPHSDATMTNIIGEEINDWQDKKSTDDKKIHLYGKSEARAGRKMGHITQLYTKN